MEGKSHVAWWPSLTSRVLRGTSIVAILIRQPVEVTDEINLIVIRRGRVVEALDEESSKIAYR